MGGGKSVRVVVEREKERKEVEAEKCELFLPQKHHARKFNNFNLTGTEQARGQNKGFPDQLLSKAFIIGVQTV